MDELIAKNESVCRFFKAVQSGDVYYHGRATLICQETSATIAIFIADLNKILTDGGDTDFPVFIQKLKIDDKQRFFNRNGGFCKLQAEILCMCREIR
ncbi:MAG: hypothetical protein ACLTDV_08990 [Eubacterium sp.]